MPTDCDNGRSAKRIRVPENESSKFLGDVITILVGKEKQALTVHECLARASSPFIDRALTAAWAEHRNRTIRLPDDEHEIVVLYVHWLYCGKLPVISDAYKVEYTQLVKAYILGDKLLSTEFQHSVIGALIERRTTFIGGRRCAPTAETVAYAYCHTIPADFLVDLAIKLFDLRPDRKEWKLKAADYCRVDAHPSETPQAERRSSEQNTTKL